MKQLQRYTVLALACASLAACGGSAHHTSTTSTSTSAAVSSSTPTGAPTSSGSVGPPASPVIYTTPPDEDQPVNPTVQKSASAPAGSTTYTDAPSPSSVDRTNPDTVAAAFIATVNTHHSTDSSSGSSWARAGYLASGLEKTELDVDGDSNSTVDPRVWSKAVSEHLNASIFVKPASTQSVDTDSTKYRCFTVTRVWSSPQSSAAMTNEPIEECLILSKSGSQWSVSSDNVIQTTD